ncbi:hypothetical protein [Hymenobacter sp. UYCo722]|uniref:hypothetical protein n=1 Tax=Hymenobacter sp. UYCo722 TaxID=3156335 RepID=UPI0033973A3A
MMKTIPIKVWNWIEMLHHPIAAIAPSSASNRNRWVAIHYATNGHAIAVQPPHRYCVIDTEFDTALLKQHTEFGDEDLAIVNQTTSYAANVTELYVLLGNLEIDPKSFTAP